MSARGLVHKDTLTFDGTNYDVWKIRMLNLFREIHPIIEGYLYVGFSSPMDTQNESLEEKLNSHIDALATKILLHVVSNVVFLLSCLIQALVRYGPSFKINIASPTLLRMIVLLPLPVKVSSHLLPLHQHVIFHKVMIW